MNIAEILEELRQERKKASNVISALEAEGDSRGTQRLLETYIQKRKVTAQVLFRYRSPNRLDE